jgi:class 3 adenylate cyclase
MTDLPAGRVTFLFTDIEGSTRLLRALGDQYAEVLTEHRRLLRAAFVRHGGFEVDTQGDSFFVVFSDPGEGLAAAEEAQQSLFAHDWPDGELRVRMGLHTGEPLVGRNLSREEWKLYLPAGAPYRATCPEWSAS